MLSYNLLNFAIIEALMGGTTSFKRFPKKSRDAEKYERK